MLTGYQFKIHILKDEHKISDPTTKQSSLFQTEHRESPNQNIKLSNL